MTNLPLADEKENALASLRAARTGKQPWATTAGALLVLERSGSLDENGLPWLKRAASESGITSNQLRRMTRTLKYVLELALLEPALAEALHWRGFSAVEVIARIYAADKTLGTRVIREEPPGSTFRQLLKIFDEVKQTSSGVGAVAAGKLAAKQFVAQGESFLAGAGHPLLYRFPFRTEPHEPEVEPHLVRTSRSLRFATPDFLIFQSADEVVRSLDGVDCHALHGNADRATVERRAVQIAMESTFFDRFLVLVPDGTAAEIFQECFSWFGIANAMAVNIEAPETETVPFPPFEVSRPFFPTTGGVRRNAWLGENNLALQAILKTAKMGLSLTS